MKDRLLNEGQTILTEEHKRQIIDTGRIPVILPEKDYFLTKN